MLKKISKKAFRPIDQEEKDLMSSIENDEWQPVKNIDQEKEKAVAAVRNSLPFGPSTALHQRPNRPAIKPLMRLVDGPKSADKNRRFLRWL